MQTQGGGRVLRNRIFFWFAAAATLVIDLASKYAAFSFLGGVPGEGQVYDGVDFRIHWVLPRVFRLICHYNTGGAFGWAAGNTILFLAAAAILVPTLILATYHCRDPKAPLWALGLIVGGALGNLYDRLFHIGVRDFFEVVNPKTGNSLWPVFNIADIAIVAGVGIYLLWSLFGAKDPQPATDQP